MLAHRVYMHLKPNSVAEFTQRLEKDILPLLRKQKGFQDEITFVGQGGRDARSPRMGVTGVRVGQRRGGQSCVADLRSIISAAHELPAEVVPPAHVWWSLRAQLEREGLLRRPLQGRLEEQTRFPMFRNKLAARQQSEDS